jgi:hypothetical protein
VNKNQTKETESKGVTMDQVMSKVSGLIIQKADRQEVHDMILGKANKVDTEMSLRWVDLLHKMVN